MPKKKKGRTELPPDTRKRFDEQFREIEMVVQAALLDARELRCERPDWSLVDLIGEQPTKDRPVTSREFLGEPGAIIAAAVITHETYATLFGDREQAAAAFRKIAEGAAELAALNATAMPRYLENVDQIELACPLAGEQPARIRESLASTLSALDAVHTSQVAMMGEQQLNLRRAPAVAAGFYQGKGAGPKGQFIFELWDLGFSPAQIAALLIFRKLRRADLTDAERQGLIAEEAARVEDRIRDYRKVLPAQRRGNPDAENPTPGAVWYLALSLYVDAYSSLSICRGSRDGVPGFYWHSSPLDPDGTPRELPPWEAQSSPT